MSAIVNLFSHKNSLPSFKVSFNNRRRARYQRAYPFAASSATPGSYTV